jgi:hypothetical protein
MVKIIIKLILEYGLRAKREKEKKSKAEVPLFSFDLLAKPKKPSIEMDGLNPAYCGTCRIKEVNIFLQELI